MLEALLRARRVRKRFHPRLLLSDGSLLNFSKLSGVDLIGLEDRVCGVCRLRVTLDFFELLLLALNGAPTAAVSQRPVNIALLLRS